MKGIIPFLAVASAMSGSQVSQESSEFSQFVINNWEKGIRELSSDEYVLAGSDKSSSNKFKVYVNTASKVHVYVTKIDGTLKVSSNDYRIVKNILDYINSDQKNILRFAEKPNIAMKKMQCPVPFEVIPIHNYEGSGESSAKIIPGNPVNVEQVFELEAKMKAFVNVAQSTKCCATGTCDGASISPGSNSQCQNCHW